ncbi:MAG: tetratricopeptide repeat protein [Sulfuricella sp.]
MSLLMKALKKAEESQQSSQSESEPTLRELADELSLEPTSEPAAVARNVPAEKPAGAGQQEAANLFSAKEPQIGKRNSFMAILSVAALLLLAGGGAYVYIAINKPGLLTSSPSSPASPAVQSVPQEANQQLALQGAAPSAVAQPDLFDAQPEAPAAPLGVKSSRSSADRATSPVAGAVKADAAPDGAIKVRHGGRSEIEPDLAQAYQFLQEGRLDEAKTHYQRMLQKEPRNVDALLGMAAVLTRSNNTSEAGKLYFRALEVEPKNTYAQAGLLNLLGSSDPAGSEAKLKQLLAEKPAGFLHFALGNLYAAQGRWPEAQQAYFQAYHLESDNPDYAFNLAVSLEQISQPKPALTYYQRALQLQRQRGADFERATVEARIAQLQKIAE